MFMQVIDVLGHPSFPGSRDTEKVDDGKVLGVLAQAYSAGVGTHRFPELGCHDHDGEVLVQASHAGRVDLDDIDRLGLEELLEKDSVLAAFPGGDLDGSDAIADLLVSEDVVR